MWRKSSENHVGFIQNTKNPWIMQRTYDILPRWKIDLCFEVWPWIKQWSNQKKKRFHIITIISTIAGLWFWNQNLNSTGIQLGFSSHFGWKTKHGFKHQPGWQYLLIDVGYVIIDDCPPPTFEPSQIVLRLRAHLDPIFANQVKDTSLIFGWKLTLLKLPWFRLKPW
jgi:hypothetical protein